MAVGPPVVINRKGARGYRKDHGTLPRSHEVDVVIVNLDRILHCVYHAGEFPALDPSQIESGARLAFD